MKVEMLYKTFARYLVTTHHRSVARNIVHWLAFFQRRQPQPVSSLVDRVRPVDSKNDGDARQTGVEESQRQSEPKTDETHVVLEAKVDTERKTLFRRALVDARRCRVEGLTRT